MNSRIKTFSAAAIALLFVAACGSSGNSPLGGIFGGGSNSGNGTYSSELRGTVDSVDINGSSIYLVNVTNSNGSMLSNSGSGNGSAVRVYFDNRTAVDYQGRAYKPADLERGDQVSVRVDQSNSRLYANSMSVLSDVRNNGYPNGNGNGNGSTYPNNGTYGSTVHGTVRSVDTYRRTITVDTGYNSGTTTIQYDANTPVYFSGRNYTVADLQPGDEIDVRTTDLGSNRYQAQDITVTRGTSGNPTNNGTYGQSSTGTIRGTVMSVDTNNHTIQLQGVSYTNFNRNTQSGGNISVQYDTNTNVDVNGQVYPVSGLERGDVVDVQVGSSSYNNSYLAQRIYLVRDVRK